MAVYERFARYYDAIYRDIVDYPGSCDFLEALFRKFAERKPASVLDLACGTGSHALILAQRGYAVTGLDRFREMLRAARAKARSIRHPLTFLQRDMARFDVHRRFGAAICMFGGLGYLPTARAFASHLASVRRSLAPGGIYVFEFWHRPGAIDRHASWIYRQRPYELIRLDLSRVDRKRSRIAMEFRFFALKGGRVVDRFTEIHTARLFTMREIRALLARTRFRLLAAYSGTPAKQGFDPVRRDAFRVTAVVRPTA